MHATLTATVWIPLSPAVPAPAGRKVEIAGPSAIDVLPNADAECQGASQEQPDLEMQKSILFLVTLSPGLDDEEIARGLGISAFDASVALRDMERAGIVLGR